MLIQTNKNFNALQKQITEEVMRNTIKEVASLNIVQMLLQVMVNGLIDCYIYKYQSLVKDKSLRVKKKGGNPYKWLYGRLEDCKKELMRKNKAIMEYAIMPCVTVSFPHYFDRFAKEGDMSMRLQYEYKKRYSSQIDELEAKVADTFRSGGLEHEIFSSVLMLEVYANLGSGMLREAMEIMLKKASAGGVNVKKQTSLVYDSLRANCSKFIDQTTGNAVYGQKEMREARQKSESLQDALVSKESMDLVDECVRAMVSEYVDYCIACLIIDARNGIEMPEEVKEHCKERIDGAPLKSLTQSIKRLSVAFKSEEPYDLMDEMEGHKYKLIEVLRKNCKDY